MSTVSIKNGHSSTLIMDRRCPKNLYTEAMTSVAPRLKELRLTASPPLSMRQAAQKLGMGHSSYGVYENPNTYKKPYLPIDLARRIAVVFADHGIDETEVMKLAGLTDAEAFPEARQIKSTKPRAQLFTVQAVMPSEAALAEMFETLLALIPPDATRVEAARILAQRLPTGFAAIGPAVYEEETDEEPDLDGLLPEPATGRREKPRPSRS